ncbi:hypothetical protein [Nonomuraea sp. SYSU D8015]|uniref:hypothetical protein n=1 Tax=Nonomuraea sp. SYSU D8015 TaxID=2593644 RepID=UPI0016605C8A|nr:hypothetical protein [Nonomuraea sp. SYSU D8015]
MTATLEAPLRPGDKVAIVDDSLDDAERTSEIVFDCDFEPVIISPIQPSVDALLDIVAAEAKGLVCDHRLSRIVRVPFDGAQVVAKSNARRIPAVLISSYIDLDESSSIRRYRAQIPRLLSKRFEPDELSEALVAAQKEQIEGPASDRVPYRTVVRVCGLRKVGVEAIAEVVIAAWRPVETVELAANLITDCVDLPLQDLVGKRFMANVNIYAKSHEDLYFTDFALAVPPVMKWLEAVEPSD